jgi:hypothetical protein
MRAQQARQLELPFKLLLSCVSFHRARDPPPCARTHPWRRARPSPGWHWPARRGNPASNKEPTQ